MLIVHVGDLAGGELAEEGTQAERTVRERFLFDGKDNPENPFSFGIKDRREPLAQPSWTGEYVHHRDGFCLLLGRQSYSDLLFGRPGGNGYFFAGAGRQAKARTGFSVLASKPT